MPQNLCKEAYIISARYFSSNTDHDTHSLKSHDDLAGVTAFSFKANMLRKEVSFRVEGPLCVTNRNFKEP